MRKRLLLILAIALLGGLMIWLMQSQSGYLLVVVGSYTLEMSLWAALLLLLVAWLLLRGVHWVLANFRATGSRLVSREWFDRTGKSRRLTNEGMIELLEGRWDSARKRLIKAAEHADEPLLNLLAAASASFELNDEKSVDDLLERATNVSGNDLAVDIVRARLLLRKQQFVVAATILEKLHRSQPDNGLILSMLFEAYQGKGGWQKAETLFADLKRLKVMTKSQLHQLQQQVFSQLLEMLAKKAVDEGSEENLLRYRSYWNGLPGAFRKEPAMQKVHIQCLYQLGESEEAEKMLRKILSKNWDDDLARLYGIIESPEPATQLMTAESWLEEHESSVPLMVALSRLCQRNELWGKARDYLEAALSLDSRPELHLDMAQLYARLGDHTRSAEHFKKGLLEADNL